MPFVVATASQPPAPAYRPLSERPALESLRHRLDDGAISTARRHLTQRLQHCLRREAALELAPPLPSSGQGGAPRPNPRPGRDLVESLADAASLATLIGAGVVRGVDPDDLRAEAELLLGASQLRLRELRELPASVPPAPESLNAIWWALSEAAHANAGPLSERAAEWLSRLRQTQQTYALTELALGAVPLPRAQGQLAHCIATTKALLQRLEPHRPRESGGFDLGMHQATWDALIPEVRIFLRLRLRELRGDALSVALNALVRRTPTTPQGQRPPAWLEPIEAFWAAQRELARVEGTETRVARDACIAAGRSLGQELSRLDSHAGRLAYMILHDWLMSETPLRLARS